MGTRGKSFVLIAFGALCSIAAVAVVAPASGDDERRAISPGQAGWESSLRGPAAPTARQVVEIDTSEENATDPAVLSANASGLTWQPGDLTPRK